MVDELYTFFAITMDIYQELSEDRYPLVYYVILVFNDI